MQNNIIEICIASPLTKNFMTTRQSVQPQYLRIIKKYWQLQSWNFFPNKFISIRVWCASSIHHCLPPTLSKQSSMKNWRNQRVRVLHYPQVLTACYELKFFPSLRVFSYDANKHWKQRNYPNPTCRYLLFVFFAWWGKITTHFYSFQRKTNKN